MKNDPFEIKPLEGCNWFAFGITGEEATTILGEPDEKDEMKEDGISSAIWYYDEKGLTLFFDEMEEDGVVLSGMEVENPEALLLGTKVFEMDENKIRAFAKDKNFGAEEVEAEEWGEKRLTFEDKLVDFYFDEAGALASISWGME